MTTEALSAFTRCSSCNETYGHAPGSLPKCPKCGHTEARAPVGPCKCGKHDKLPVQVTGELHTAAYCMDHMPRKLGTTANEHDWRDTKVIAREAIETSFWSRFQRRPADLGVHMKQICARCGIETFESGRHLNMRIPCKERQLEPDQLALIRGELPAGYVEPATSRRAIVAAFLLVLLVLACIFWIVFTAR